MEEFILTKEDNNSVIEVDRGDHIKIILPEAAATGYIWSFDGNLPQTVELLVDEYKMTYKKTLGGGGKHLIEFKAKEIGEATIKLKYWQEWNGDDSIEDRFETKIVIE